MLKSDLPHYSQKIASVLKKDSLDILFLLRQHNCRFRDLPGNSFTKSKRLKELRLAGLIEPVIIEQDRKERPVIGYRLTEKGVNLLDKLEIIFKIL
ncbi:Uncharacterised protein [Candidatus Bilamarchaeum dharawalense]|uniref:HTH hxlR-type domain-containing protein n=1 Tax=Candidatus Bilamarchaeum dharawalense TaxID=2885759 RepID=A0A5E4LN82_9ARCH|nr:Uncharacterised protein [Candidatus Bilamarchaeum dharawalense]